MSARVFAVLFSTLVLAACAQTEGEICQLESDCEGDLICCKNSATDPDSVRGVCDTMAACAAFRAVDATIVEDAGMVDSGPVDAQVVGPGIGRPCGDAGLCASGLVCFRGVCLLPEDADAGLEEDAGTDAGQDAGTDGGPEDAGGDDAGLDGGP